MVAGSIIQAIKSTSSSTSTSSKQQHQQYKLQPHYPNKINDNIVNNNDAMILGYQY